MVLNSVVTTTRAEVEWVTRSMGRVFPNEWERFCNGVGEEDRDGDLSAAYSHLLQTRIQRFVTAQRRRGARGRTPTSGHTPDTSRTLATEIRRSGCASPAL